jgi:hypothetical protein
MSTAAALGSERAARRAPVALDPVRSGLEALSLFFLIQTALLLHARQLAWQFFATTGGSRWASSMVGPIWPDLVTSMLPFVAIALSGVVLAVLGHRYAWALPAGVWFAMSFFLGGIAHVPHPQALGAGWMPPPGTPIGSPEWWAQPWAGALVDYGLALLPAAVIAARAAAASPARDGGFPAVAGRVRAIRVRPEAVAALALCCIFVWLAVTSSTEAIDPTQPWSAATTLLPPFLFGLLLGTRRPGLLWAAVAVPFLFQVDASSFIWPSVQGTTSAVLTALPCVVMCAVGVAYLPMARAFERLRDAPLAAVVLLNVLNVADAVLTWIAVRSHQAVEANPVVRLLGLPAKVLIVALISVFLYRLRPRAIVWGVAVMVAVIAWHVAGLYLTATV